MRQWLVRGPRRRRPWADLKRRGFVSIINFRTAEERGATVEAGKAAAAEAGLKYFHLPFGTATAEVTEQFLDRVSDPSNQPVFIPLWLGEPRWRYVVHQAREGRRVGHRPRHGRGRNHRPSQPGAQGVCDELRSTLSGSGRSWARCGDAHRRGPSTCAAADGFMRRTPWHGS